MLQALQEKSTKWNVKHSPVVGDGEAMMTGEKKRTEE